MTAQPKPFANTAKVFCRLALLKCREISAKAQLLPSWINYDAASLDKIKGRKTGEIAAILGDKPYDEAIHRDNMIVHK